MRHVAEYPAFEDPCRERGYPHNQQTGIGTARGPTEALAPEVQKRKAREGRLFAVQRNPREPNQAPRCFAQERVPTIARPSNRERSLSGIEGPRHGPLHRRARARGERRV